MTHLTENIMVLGNSNFNYYVVGQEEAVLIECGTSAGVSIFAEQWLAMDQKPQIKIILVMHSHFDHVCGIPMLRDLFPQAQVVASRQAQKILSLDKLKPVLIRADEFVTNAYARDGLLRNTPGGLDIDRVKADVIVGEGDSIAVDGKLRLDIIEAPGHSSCSLAAYFQTDEAMFISDACGYQDDDLISPGFFQDYDLYRSTINRLQKYPTRLLGFGHGKVQVGADQVAQSYARSLESADDSFDLIKTWLTSGISEEIIVKNLYDKYIKGGMSYYPRDLMMGSVYMLVKNVKNRI